MGSSGIKLGIFLFFVSLFSPTFASGKACQINRALEFYQLNFPRNDIRFTDRLLIAYEMDETLIRANQRGEIVSGLAKDWVLDRETNEYTFTLSDECAWSDGVKITAHDFVAGLQDLYKYGTPALPSWNVIKGADEIVNEGKKVETLAVKAIDDKTVRIGVVGDPEFALQTLSYAAFAPLPTHLKSGQQSWQLISPTRVTSGPFRTLSSNRNEIIAVKNKHYCKSRHPKIDRIRMFNKTEDFNPIREFITGKLDLIRDISSQQLISVLGAFPKDKRPNFLGEKTYRQVYLLLNSELNGLQDIEIRSAIRQGIDFPNLLEPRGAIDQYFKKAESVFYDLPQYENIKYDTKDAVHDEGLKNLIKIMESKGYSAENPMKLTLKTWPIPRFVTVSKLMASMLRPAHFDIRYVQSKSVSAAFEDLSTGRFDLFIGSWVLDYLDVQNSWEGVRQFLLPALTSKSKLEDFGLPTNFRSLINTLNLELVEAKTTAERYSVLQQLEKLLSTAHIILPLYTEQTGVLYVKGLKINNSVNLYSRTSYWENCEPSKEADDVQ